MTTQRIKAFLLGMREFRSDTTTDPGDSLIEAYDRGRELAHRLTFRRWDASRRSGTTERIWSDAERAALAGLRTASVPFSIAARSTLPDESQEGDFMSIRDRIPTHWPVKPLDDTDPRTLAIGSRCGTCGLYWDDSVSTSMTPAPSGRCPFEEFHEVRTAAPLLGGRRPAREVDTRPILDLSYTSGRWVIGGTDLDDDGVPIRTYTLATQEPHTATKVMLRRFDDLVRLMAGNVQVRKNLWATEEEAQAEADDLNADDDWDGRTWQTAFVNDGRGGGYWTVTLDNGV